MPKIESHQNNNNLLCFRAEIQKVCLKFFLSHSYVLLKMRWLLKLQLNFDQIVILKITSFLEGHESYTLRTFRITRIHNMQFTLWQLSLRSTDRNFKKA